MNTAGLTGCNSGWLLISLSEESSYYKLIESDDDLGKFLGDQDRVLVNVPIGLMDNEPLRPCDRLLLQRLGSESQTEVIPPPIRTSLDAPSYAEANMECFEQTGENLPVKSWALTPRIKLLDRLIRVDPSLGKCLFESHPELLLMRLNGRKIYQQKGTRKGLRHRVELVADQFSEVADFFREIKEEYRRNEVEEVDIVHAAALAWGAVTSLESGLKTLPENPEPDRFGLIRAIHYV